MKHLLLAAVAAATCITGSAVQAHHSFPATYLVDQEVVVEGELVAFMFRNPHSFVHMTVKDKSGKLTRYAIEWGSAGALGRTGVTRATFKAGDVVKIWGNPGRNDEDHRIRMRRIERPADGYRWGFTGETFD